MYPLPLDLQTLLSFYSRDKIYTLKEYVKGESGDIIDPFGGSLSDYQKTRDELEQLLKKLAEMLAGKSRE
ncbi:Low molecular weight protein tyrosine phosphatase [Bacillus paralicheniformis]|nr:Low molecular weight protein tyrosine phosphatase [Bacillus paralicheniformis]